MAVSPERETQCREVAQKFIAEQMTPQSLLDNPEVAEMYAFVWVSEGNTYDVRLHTWQRDAYGIEVEGSHASPDMAFWFTRIALFSGDTDFRRVHGIQLCEAVVSRMLVTRVKDTFSVHGRERPFKDYAVN